MLFEIPQTYEYHPKRSVECGVEEGVGVGSVRVGSDDGIGVVGVGVEDRIVSLEPNDDFAMGAPPGAPGAIDRNKAIAPEVEPE